ncbi:MAG: ABC-2 family transporter protein [Phycisphaerae bacterium]|nr:ABC-2 family transporter protein [Phycisphaerae bacterium]
MKALTANKYLVIFLTQFKNLLEYRVNIALKLIRPIIMTAAVASLWMVLFQVSGKDTIAGFDRSGFIFYLLVVRYIAIFSPGGRLIADMNEEICNGNLTMRLVRPMHYLAWLFFRALPIPLFCGIMGVAMITAGAMMFDAVMPSGVRMVIFIFSVIATVITQYAFYIGIGILSFWVYEVMPFDRFFRTVNNLLSGQLLPLTIFDDGVRNVLIFLPFASLAYNPAAIYTGKIETTLAIYVVLGQFFWAIVLWLMVIFAYNKGLKKFEAQGG